MPPKRNHNNVDVDEDEEGEGEDDVKTIRIVSPTQKETPGAGVKTGK